MPDTQPIHFSIPMFQDGMSGPDNGFSLIVGLIRPQARGSVKLTGAHLQDELAIGLAALDNQTDVDATVASVRQCLQMGRTKALAPWGVHEIYPGPGVSDDDVPLEDYVRTRISTYHHQAGTCRMGEDARAVVDPRSLKVRGLANVCVADASVMPLLPTGNTNAPAVLIGEKATELITGRPAGSPALEDTVSADYRYGPQSRANERVGGLA